MTQNAWTPLVPAADNGTTLSNKLNGLVPAIYSTNRGTSRPAYAVAGMLWVDSSTATNEKLYLYDGAHDILLMAWDSTTGVLTFGGGGSIAEFDATKAYQADDLMIRNGGIYKATQATGPGAYNAAHWTQIDAAAVTVPPAILRAPTTAAQNTITQSVDDQVPLKIAPSETSTAKQFEIGSSFTVDKEGALYAAGRVTVENDAKIINDAADSISGANGSAVKLFSENTGASHTGLAIGVGDAPAADKFFISAKADPALTHGGSTTGSDAQFSVSTEGGGYFAGHVGIGRQPLANYELRISRPSNAPAGMTNGMIYANDLRATVSAKTEGVFLAITQALQASLANVTLFGGQNSSGEVFRVQADGSGYFAGSLGVGAAPGTNYKARITAGTSHQFGLFVDQLQHTASNCYAFYTNYGGGSAQATGFYAGAVGSGVAGSIGFESVLQAAEANKSLSRHFRARVGSTEVFTVSGNGEVTAAGNITAFSDKRLKTNIKPLTDALAAIAAIDAYTFDRADIKTRQAGVIAQELLAVLPEAVQKADDERGTLSVNYGAVAALAIAGCKALQSEIETLAVKNRLLEQRLERLEILMDQSLGD